MRTPTDYLADAAAAFEAGFISKAAQKRALDDLNRAYSRARDEATNAMLAAKRDAGGDVSADYWELPFDLHNVRDRHVAIFTAWTPGHAVADMVAMRAEIKAAAIAAPVVNETKARVETVRRSIVEEMERRKAQYVEALAIGRLFGGLPVSVNAHWVHGHKGAVFLRHFFYLRGRLTPLNTIIAAAEQLERETA